jgi:hypothetical protein
MHSHPWIILRMSKCGNENLETVLASPIDVTANKIKDLFK